MSKKIKITEVSKNDFPYLVESFFTDYLVAQKGSSQHTIASYRDTFKLLLVYFRDQKGLEPSSLSLTSVDSKKVLEFLNYLEKSRGVTPRSRNQRLAVLRSFFKYVSFKNPEYIHHCQKVLAIPRKQQIKKLINFLSEDEISAISDAIDRETWLGRRDYCLLVVALETGMRVSEITSLKPSQLVLSSGGYISFEGKGRKTRCTPINLKVRKLLKAWIKENSFLDEHFIFQSTYGGRLSSDAVQAILKKYSGKAQGKCKTLKAKTVSPHVLRHTTAMRLLHSGVDCTVIALWMGHESIETTQVYLQADTELKKAALKKISPRKLKSHTYKPNNRTLEFLESL